MSAKYFVSAAILSLGVLCGLSSTSYGAKDGFALVLKAGGPHPNDYFVKEHNCELRDNQVMTYKGVEGLYIMSTQTIDIGLDGGTEGVGDLVLKVQNLPESTLTYGKDTAVRNYWIEWDSRPRSLLRSEQTNFGKRTVVVSDNSAAAQTLVALIDAACEP